MAPLAKTGGLADVTAALGAYLHRAGHEVRVLMPRYSRLERQGLVIEPVRGLEGLTMSLGSRRVDYSIDRTILPGTRLPVYLLRCPAFYARDGVYTQDDDEYLRFVMLTRASLEMCQRTGFAPHIAQANDWHTALLPLYLKTTYAWDKLFADTRSVLTIHNIGYQGIFPASIVGSLELGGAEHHLHQDDLAAGRVNFMKTGILYADLVTTVSPTYAREIQGSDYGMGLDGLLRERSDTVVGILNGVDYNEWNPEKDDLIPARYSAKDLEGKRRCKLELMRQMGLDEDPDVPLIGIVSRMVGQKGIDLIRRTVPALLTQRNFSLAVLGSGEPQYESFFAWMQHHFRGRVAYYRGYSEKLAHWIEAGADMFLMPSLYEPCGLNQMYSLKYGTVPIVRQTGGLADSVEQVDPARGTGTGIVFRDYDEAGLDWAIRTALDLYADRALWDRIVANGMAKDFSWERQGARYIDLFRQLGGVQ